MANETQITIIGNLTADPELRFTASGAAVANFTVASTPRKFNKNTSEWEDGDTLFMRCTIWRTAAENVTESFTKGSRVIVVGRLNQRSYDTKEGEKRIVIELEADEVAASVQFASVKINRADRQQAAPQRGQQRQQGRPDQRRQQPADDPWGSAPPARTGGGYSDDAPPF